MSIRQHLRGKCLVQFYQVNVIHGQTSTLKQFGNGEDRANTHFVWLDACYRHTAVSTQRLQAFFPCHARSGLTLGFEGQVDIFKCRFRVGSGNRTGQRIGQFALFFNARKNAGPAAFHLAQVMQTLFQQPHLGIIQFAGHLLAVAGDKGNSRPLIQ